jgi:outer membrane protein, heavy metal efflux system
MPWTWTVPAAGTVATAPARPLILSLAAAALLSCLPGCAGGASAHRQQSPNAEHVVVRQQSASAFDRQPRTEPAEVILTNAEEPLPPAPLPVTAEEAAPESWSPPVTDDLETLLALADAANPRVRQLRQEAAAAWAKVRYVDKLPDPTVGANVFGHPIETAAGSQRANLTVMQMIPWLSRLDAQSQQAAFEAMAAQQAAEAERLKVIAEVRVAWYRLFVLGKQIETTQANQQLLATLVEVATARVATGEATQGDVLLATLELSRLQEQLVTLEQQVISTQADLNRRVGRHARYPIPLPEELDVTLPEWSHELLLETARQRQPEIAAAELRTSAARWGIEIARLRQRPDLSLSASWFAIEGNRPASPIVDVGRDAWSLGAQVSVPLWHGKYRAMRDEAAWKHSASRAAVEDVVRMYDALLRDLLAQARSAHEIATLYEETIIPQAQQTLESDQRAFAENVVEFDRVIQDFRNLLVMELAYHQSLGQLAIAVAQIEQAAGTRLAQ